MPQTRISSAAIAAVLLTAVGQPSQAQKTVPVRLALACGEGPQLEAFVVTGEQKNTLRMLGAPDSIVRAGEQTLTIIDGDRTLQFKNSRVIVVESGEVTKSDCLDISSEFKRLSSLIADREIDSADTETKAAKRTIEELRSQLSTRKEALEAAAETIKQYREDLERVAKERDAAHARKIERLHAAIKGKDEVISRLSRERTVALSGVPPEQIEAALSQDGFDPSSLEKLVAASDTTVDTRETLLSDIAAVSKETPAMVVNQLQDRIRAVILEDGEASIIRSEALVDEVDVLRAVIVKEKAARAEMEKKLGDEISHLEASLDAGEAQRVDLEMQLSAALVAKDRSEQAAENASAEATRREALLAAARSQLAKEEELSLERQRKVQLLNEQVRQLRMKASSLQELLEKAEERNREADMQIKALAANLNASLAQVAQELRERQARGSEVGGQVAIAAEDMFASLRTAVQRCWNVDVDSEAAQIAVTVQVLFDRGGQVDGAPSVVSMSDGPDIARRAAIDAARRAILRCSGSGYDLPVDKYDQWREVTISFDPSQK